MTRRFYTLIKRILEGLESLGKRVESADPWKMKKIEGANQEGLQGEGPDGQKQSKGKSSSR